VIAPGVIGIDGCRAGWIVVHGSARAGPVEAAIAPDWCTVMDRRFAMAAVDMPIGLPDAGARHCDRAARDLLGWPRMLSVFLHLRRPLLDFADYPAANEWARADGKGLSKQAWFLLPKIAEIDRWITPRRQARLREAHPELIFRALNGGTALAESKKTRAGHRQRRALLERAGFADIGSWLERLTPAFRRGHAAPDDLLDAYACCWTARRLAAGRAVHVTGHVASHDDGQVWRDSRGLLMEICY
jgi:predicted RNase H-like nuclease